MNRHSKASSSTDYEPLLAGDLGREIHLWDYVNIVLKRIYIAVAILLTVLILGAVYSWTRTPMYVAKANILVENKGVDLTDIEGPVAQEGSTGKSAEFVQTQMKLITSRPVMEKVLRDTGLDQTPEFREAGEPVLKLARMIKVQQTRNSMLVDVSIERASSQEAASIVNATVQAFIEETRRRRAGISDQGLVDLENKVVDLRKALDDATKEYNDFLSKNNIISFSEATTMVTDRVAGLNESLWRSEPIRLKLRAQVEAAEKALAEGRSIDSLPFVMESSIIANLNLQLAQKGIEEAEMRERLGENHPQLQAHEAQRIALQNQIGIFAIAALESLRIQHAQADKETELMRAAIAETADEIRQFNDLQTEHEYYQRRRTNASISHTRILRRIEDIRVNMIDGQGDRVFVIAEAKPPQQRSSPNHRKNMALTLVFGSLMAIGFCFFLEYMDTTIKSMEEAQEIFNARTLGAIPMAETIDAQKTSHDLATAENPKSALAEAFRMIRSSVQFANGGNAVRHLVITSTLPQEGKSMCSINIALSYAQANKKVLLIDADLRKPRMHTAFEVSNDKGFSQLLQQQQTGKLLDELIMKTRFDNLHILTAGPVPLNPAELLDSDFMATLIRELETIYDVVIFDSPPSANLADSIIIAKYVDAIAVVVRLLSTPRDAAKYFSYNLTASNANLLGLILNNVDTPTNRYGYGYQAYGAYGQDQGPYGAETTKSSRFKKTPKTTPSDAPSEAS